MNETTTNSYAIDVNWAQPLLHTTNSLKYTNSPMGKNVVFDYDANFRKTSQVSALGTPDEAWTLFEYDAVGNLTKTTDPRFNVTRFDYDDRNRQTAVTNALNQVTRVEYDEANNKKKEIRPDGTFRSWDYDSMNRVWRAYDWRTNEPPTPNQTTTYGRDLAGNAISITDTKGAVYSFDYDALNRKKRETYPADASGTNRWEYWQYDAAGNIIQYYNPAGYIKTMGYDSRNRLVCSWWNGGGGASLTFAYDAASRMTSVVTGLSATTVAFGYDDANRKIWEDQTVAGYPTRRVMSDLDADGNRENLQVPGVYLIHFDYTQRNQLSHIYQASGGVFSSYNYDAAGNMKKRKNEWGGVNDSTNCQYDELNRPTMWEQTGPGDVPFARSWYQYDNVGREVATWRDEEGSKGERFSYNPTNQVTRVQYKAEQVWTGNPLNAFHTTDYNYTPDRLNRQSVTENGVASNYSVNGLNQYTAIAGQALQYDDYFNLTGYNGGTYTYDSANRLVSANNDSVQFTYDGLGRCVKRTVNGVPTVFVFDGWKPMLEFDGTGTPRVWNIYGAGADEILMRITDTDLVRYHLDRMGNVAFLLGGDGNGVEKYTYNAFGQPKIMDWSGNERSNSAFGNRFMFTGREFIRELGIYDYRNRFYHPGIGRFLQTDPTGFDGGDMNLFRYCADDPVDRTDPTGLVATNSSSNIWGNLMNFYSGNPSMDVVQDAWNQQRFGGFTMAQVTKNEEKKNGGGLMPLPSDLLGRMWTTHLENVEEANDRSNWTAIPGTHKRRQEEYATGIYRKRNGLVQDGPNKGWHEGIKPMSEAFRKEYRGGGTRAAATHVHVTGNGRHLLFDQNQAIRYRYISGTGSASAPGRLDIFVPLQSGRGGQYFHTDDGVHLSPGH